MGKKKALQALDEEELGFVQEKMRCSFGDLDNYKSLLKLLDYKIQLKCKNEKQKEFLNQLKNDKYQICFAQGSAGSGKSFISIGYALTALKDQSNSFDKIILLVPTAEAGNMSLGYLKGDLEAKMLPYLEADKYTMEKRKHIPQGNCG